jgi:antitoxin HigA-1
MSSFPRDRQPTTPDEILREDLLVPPGITQKQLARHLGCDVKVVNRIVSGRSAVNTEVAMKLGAAFRTTPDFWLNAQKAVDLWEASQGHVELPPPLVRAS